ncbi:MAG TPA: penicillin-binding protein 2, partial [Actinomycetota bacterium]|nr:penicillin-binding protein 2 [Actinomycetota bacterium]
TGGDRVTEGKTGGRIRILVWVLAFMLASIVTRLWFLQVLAVEEYQDRAEENRVELVKIPAPRGRIVDRNGRFLVESQTKIVVTVRREEVENSEKLLLDLARVLKVPADQLAKRLTDPDYGPFEAVPVAIGVSEEDALYLEEHNREFPGVDHRVIGVRNYPEGSLAAHVLGYLGEINEDELNDRVRFPPSYYGPGQQVGRGGVEAQYERYLRGKPGEVKLQVDARGQKKGELSRGRAIPGNDVALTIDRKIQKAAEEALLAGVKHAKGVYHEDSGRYLKARAGAVVVMDPSNGEVLAMASYPTYDPQVFLEGLTKEEWDRLNNPKRNFPMNNRAILAQYPPGSVLKPFVAAAAVRSGYARPNGFYPCPAEFTVEGDTSQTVFRNWKDHDSGVISFSRALAESCDTVFYKWGLEFYRERKIRGELLQQHLNAWLFGRETNVDLDPEEEGRVPDAAWKAKIHEQEPDLFPDEVWYPGDTINMSIGQGDFLATPLQVARAFAALGNGGVLYRPHVGREVRAPDGRVIRRMPVVEEGRVPYGKKLLARIRGALQDVVSHGTAAHAFAGFPTGSIPVAGKTGTSEVHNKQPHSWFVGMAPAHDPQYVVAAVVEEGGHGSEVAAPIVRRIFEKVFDLDVTPFQIAPASD